MTGKTIRSDSALPTRSRIYRALYESVDFCSRQTLAEICDVSMPTVHQNLKELLEQEGQVAHQLEALAVEGGPAQQVVKGQPVEGSAHGAQAGVP